MIKNAIRMVDGATVQVRLCEIDESGYALVNDHHYALAIGQPLDVSSALRKGVNVLKLVVDNTGRSVPFFGKLPGGIWHGRFQLYINGGLVGAYADKGNDGLGQREHTVAEIELLVTEPAPGENVEKEQPSWIWRVLGY